MFMYFSQIRVHRFAALSALLGLVIAAGGCESEPDDVGPKSQVVARVNGEEITVHELRDALDRSQNVPGQSAEDSRRRILDQLIDQRLAAQMAIEGKLDRTPKVMQAIEASKRDILARAYLEHVAASAPERYEWDLQNQQQVSDYYASHPELFAQRRIFTIEEISFVAPDELAVSVRDFLSQSPAMQEVADWLTSQGVKFSAKRSTRAAEQMSLRYLPQIQAMKAGELKLFELGSGQFQVIRVVAFKDAPVDEKTASPRIAQFLSNRESSGILAAEMKRIREAATIEYVDDLASEQGTQAESGNPAE